MSSSSKDKSLQSPLRGARGLGSTGHGTEHWMHQRVTAISNFLLMVWLVWSFVSHQLSGASYEEFTAWLSAPLNAILMILAVISVFYHAALGAQVVVEDYISNEAFKMVKLIGVKLSFLAIGVAAVFAILKIAFGA